jgi:ribonuclease HI
VNGCIDSLKLPDADRTTTKRTTEAASTTERKRPRSADAPTVIIAIQFDGGSRGNPGRAGSGAVVRITQQMSLSTNNTVTTQWQTKTWHARSFVPISATNNEAEYNGVIVGLTITAEELHKLHPNEEEERTFSIEMHIQGDSNLVIQQMRREWKVNKESLKPYFEEAMRLLEKEIQPEECTMLHVYRSDNQLADRKFSFRVKNEVCVYDSLLTHLQTHATLAAFTSFQQSSPMKQ